MPQAVTPLPPGTARPLSALHAACFPQDPWDAASLDRILGLSGVFGYLGWDGEDPTGFVLARDLADEAEILSLAVLPAFRRRGIGRALLDAAFAEARRRGAGSVVLEVAAENRSARRLYAACGFVQVGRRPGYYRSDGQTVDGLILRCSIAASA